MSQSPATPFGRDYAAAYDAMYETKDYAGECTVLERIFAAYADGPVRRVLDLGCGTGGHSLELARRGYAVLGIDRSPSMLDVARAKAAGLGGAGEVRFEEGNLTALAPTTKEPFDAAILMFAVLGYLTENADVLAALRAIRAQLRPGAVLAFDIWYGPAVLTLRPGERFKELPMPSGSLLRLARGRLDTARHVCTVDYDLLHLDGPRVLSRAREAHVMRFFFAQELKLFLELAGFTLQRLARFEDLEQPASDDSWNAWVVATAS